MSWGILRSIIILPGTALVLIPALLVRLTAGTTFAAHVAGPERVVFWVGLPVGCLGLALSVWTVALFAKYGGGTPAPWDPPRRFVVRGPYRHVRNPMIIGALLMLVAESLVFRSLPLAFWAVVFFAMNAAYFPLREEKRLEERFGDDYRAYRANVPRWAPRLHGWSGGDSQKE